MITAPNTGCGRPSQGRYRTAADGNVATTHPAPRSDAGGILTAGSTDGAALNNNITTVLAVFVFAADTRGISVAGDIQFPSPRNGKRLAFRDKDSRE